jgi:hypothetical protein
MDEALATATTCRKSTADVAKELETTPLLTRIGVVERSGLATCP